MAGNSFGDLYRIITYGESHGNEIGVVVDGCPSGLELNIRQIQYELDRRKPGQSKVTTQRKEKDIVEIDSGVFNGITLGTPIKLSVKNCTFDSSKYENIKDKYRFGHADHVYFAKYGIRDYRGGGRASARETIGRVIGGAIAKQILKKYNNTEVKGCTVNIGGIEAIERNYNYIEKNILRCPDSKVYKKMMKKVDEVIKKNDSIGGAVEVIAKNVPIGLGEPVFDKLSADLMKAFGSIGAVKGVYIGNKNVEKMLGSEYNDKMTAENKRIRYLTNNAGGIIGGISNGENIIARLSVKPTPTRKNIEMTLPTEKYENKRVIIKGEHDSIIMPRLVPVAEAMMAMVLVDYLLKQNAYNFSTLEQP